MDRVPIIDYGVSISIENFVENVKSSIGNRFVPVFEECKPIIPDEEDGSVTEGEGKFDE
jgi:hypothetical protein